MITCIIASAGSGKRFGGDVPKQFINLGQETVLEMSVRKFQENEKIDRIILVCPKEYVEKTKELTKKFSKVTDYVVGGKERQDSVYEGLKLVTEGMVLIHDGARPFVTQDVIDRVIAKAKDKSVVPCVKVKDTIRTLNGNLNRDELFSVQTPQGFPAGILKQAYEKAFEDGFYGTDDAGLVERLGEKIEIVEGDYENKKITTKEDISEMNIRVGFGYDVHKLVEGRDLYLCGEKIPHEKGLLGHSDADVALHALMDAILGAAALGDIGKHFPDKDPAYEGISSMILLEKVKSLIYDKGYKVSNVDVTIICEKPKILPHVEKMRENIAGMLGISLEQVNIKGTTTEKLGFTGREEGIAASAVATIYK